MDTTTDILPREGDPVGRTETWLDARRYFTASPKLSVQLELDGGKTVKADAGVDGFDAIGANVPEGTVQVLVAYQFNPETGERRNDEKAFDEMSSRPSGWSSVPDPVAEIRKMRDGDA